MSVSHVIAEDLLFTDIGRHSIVTEWTSLVAVNEQDDATVGSMMKLVEIHATKNRAGKILFFNKKLILFSFVAY